MLRFSNDQRLFVAEGLRELANLAAAALLFGQFVADRPFSPLAALGGMLVWIALMAIGVGFRWTRKE
jgi:hypothetical protein